MKSFLITSCFMIFAPLLYAENPQLTVTGESMLYKPADTMTLTLGVETFDQDAQKAIQANAQKMGGIRAALLKAGLSENELQTQSYTLAPQYKPTPEKPPRDWKPSIIGYEVSNTLEIYTNKLDAAGTLIDVASNAGANFVQSISFALQNEQNAKAEAIALAVRNAATYAQAAVKEAGLKLGPIAELTIDQGSNVGFYKGARAYSAQEAVTSISPRDIEVSASVSIVYTIESTQFQRDPQK